MICGVAIFRLPDKSYLVVSDTLDEAFLARSLRSLRPEHERQVSVGSPWPSPDARLELLGFSALLCVCSRPELSLSELEGLEVGLSELEGVGPHVLLLTLLKLPT